ncbi:class I SAM-dependent rRNA methyltransferase [Halobacillus salinarum]|uniref:Class I SAM-dependent rRNA methyltransferase n=1 Tax=Halobacillus salinarum TaxID=2932257 RepID=A0ABY4EM23_9BACI|nr:class I SAM-dependent rRNA methyltransferase [Halobacillus salinarum]UOQ45050.1 class I SAM-dependent rRNA methyltransferase [Halobacillus salinarum]
MAQEFTVKLRYPHVNKYKKGYPLILKDAIDRPELLKQEGAVIKVLDDQGNFVGRGFAGKQNKGLGWIVTHQESDQLDASFFDQKIQHALEKRHAFFLDEDTDAFRIFNGEGDGIGGLTIDYFAGYYVINFYSEGIYAFQSWVIDAIKRMTDYKAIYQKKRFGKQGTYIEEDEFVAGERGEFPIIVKENGIRLAVYLNEGAMVGVFLDQREVRKTLRDQYAEGCSVLNTFSYTGAFSIFASAGGASHTTSVDLANRSYAKTIENFSMNALDFEAQDIIVEDVFKYFKYAKRKEKSFDIVVLDPPSFARSKKHMFRAEKDYPSLLKQTIDITEDQGMIIASTNCSKFNMNKFKQFVKQAFQQSGCPYRIEKEFSLPSDFPTLPHFKEGNYLKVLFIRKG